MRLDEYTTENETIVSRVKARESNDMSEGEIGVTKNRTIYVAGHDVVDISHGGVHTIEYREGSYPMSVAYLSGFLVFAGFFVIVAGGSLPVDMMENVLGGLLLGAAAITAVVGFFLKSPKITLQTPSKEYKFASKDDSLEDIAHTLRKFN